MMFQTDFLRNMPPSYAPNDPNQQATCKSTLSTLLQSSLVILTFWSFFYDEKNALALCLCNLIYPRIDSNNAELLSSYLKLMWPEMTIPHRFKSIWPTVSHLLDHFVHFPPFTDSGR